MGNPIQIIESKIKESLDTAFKSFYGSTFDVEIVDMKANLDLKNNKGKVSFQVNFSWIGE